MVYYLLATLYVFVCLVLLMVILLQQGKGGEMANAFGGGNSQAAFGARGGATMLSKMTTGCAVLFMIGAIMLGIMRRSGSSSLMGGTPAPPAPASAPAASTPPSGTTPAAGTTPAPAAAPGTPATPASGPAPAEKK
jgi:preprotein translocase subunit SecG